MATEKLIVELDAKTVNFNRKMASAGASATKATNKINTGFNKVDRSIKKTTDTTKKFNVATVAVAVSAALAANKIIGYSDAMTSITNKLKLATDSTEDLNKVTSELFNIANNTRSSVTATVGLYSKLERSTRTLNISQDRLLKITGSINKAFAIGGATTAEATGSIRQLGQALASGVLRGDEFNSIAEQAPVIMEAVIAATGKTSGELRTLAATGALTSKILIESLERYSSKIDTDYAEATETFAQKMEIAQNNTIKFVGANESLNSIIGVTGDKIVELSNNLNVLITTGEIAIVLFGARLTASLTEMAFKASVSALATIRMAGGLTAVGAAAGVAEFSTLKAARGFSIMGASAKGATAAMALLGGPVGVLVTVVAALVLFVDWETEAEKQAAKTTKAISDQEAAFKGLSEEQSKIKMAEFAESAVKAQFKLIPLREELEKLEKKLNAPLAGSSLLGGSQILFEQNRRKAEELRKEILELESISDIAAAGFKTLEGDPEEKKKKKELIEIGGGDAEKKRLEALEKQKLADEQELQAIIDRLKSEEELLIEQFEQEKEILELRIEDKNVFNSTILGLENEFQDNLQKIKDKELKAAEALANKKLRLAQKEKREKLQAIDDTRKTIDIGKGLNEALFNDNKAIRKGLIVADTAMAIQRQFADLPFPAALATSAIIAANGLTQLKNVDSATRGGGSISSSGGNSGSVDQGQGGLSDDQQAFQDTSTLEVTDQSEAGTNTREIRFAVDHGDSILDAIAEGLNSNMRNGG